MREDSDLTTEERSAIEDAERIAKRGTHWEVLGLVGSPSSVDVKRAYFAASKRFHPDRYFGKHLGEMRPRLEALFIRIKQAHDVLVDDEQRERYAALHPAPQPPREKTKDEIEREQRLDERRKQLVSERSNKRKEGLRGAFIGLKARRLATVAKAALEADDLTAAKVAIDELSRERPNDKETIVLAAQLLERQGKRDAALERYRAARELDGADADVTNAIQRLMRP